MAVDQRYLAFSNKQPGQVGKRTANQEDRAKAAQILVPRLIFILATVALVVAGLIMVYSASFVEAFTNPKITDSSFFFKNQLKWAGVGLIALLLAAFISYRIWNYHPAIRSWASWIPWLVVVLLLVYTLAIGNEENGAQRWSDVFGNNFQASEFAKIAILLVSAMLLVKLHNGAEIKKIVVLAAMAIGLPVLLIMLQPDLGTTLIILAGIIAVAWFGELPMKPLAIMVLMAVFIAAGIIILPGLFGHADFRPARIDAWLDPWSMAENEGYQIINSLFAFAGGGLTGVGLGMSHQKYLYLPNAHNDSIFPIIGEEFGLLGTVFVVLLFLVFLYSAFRIARNASDFYGRIIAGSAASMIGSQAFLNMFCATNLFPLTGKPLPFFSAGGSSLITTLILVGLILNVSLRSTIPDAASARRDQLLILEGGRAKASAAIPVAATQRIAAEPMKRQTVAVKPRVAKSPGTVKLTWAKSRAPVRKQAKLRAPVREQVKSQTPMPPQAQLREQIQAQAQGSSRYRKPGANIKTAAAKPKLRHMPQRPTPASVHPSLKLSPARRVGQSTIAGRDLKPSTQRSTNR